MSYVNKGTISPTVIVTSEPDRSGNFVCNGTNDEVTIQAAITYMDALLTGRAYKAKILLKGDFLIEDTITLVSYMTLEVQGRMYLANAMGAHMILIGDGGSNAFSDIDIIGGEWDGNRANQAALFSCIEMWQDCTRIRVFDATFHGWYGKTINNFGFPGHLNSDISVIHCFGYDYEPSPVDADFFDNDQAQYVIAANNTIVDVGNDAIDMGAVNRFVIADNIIHGGLDGIEIYASVNGTITGNVVYDMTAYGIYIRATRQISVTGNAVSYCDEHGMRVLECYDSSITANAFWRNNYGDTTYPELGIEDSHDLVILGNSIQAEHPTIKADYCIDMDANSHYNIVAYNICGEPDNDCIRVAGDYNQIKDNYVYGSVTQYGINIVAGATENVVKGNRFLNNNLGPIVDAGTDTIYAVIQSQFVYWGGGSAGYEDNWNTAPSGIDLDANDERAFAHVTLPLELYRVMKVKIWAYSKVAEAAGAMRLRIAMYAGFSGQTWITQIIDVPNKNSEEVGGIAIEDVIHWVITKADDTDLGDLRGGHFIEIVALGEVAGNGDAATDASFGAIEIEYI